MNKLLKVILGLALLPLMAMADSEVDGTFDAGASGTASATVFLSPSTTFQNITDLGWKLDAGVTTGNVQFRIGDIRYAVNSATSGSGTVVWFANTGTPVTSQEYIIIYDESVGTYLLRQVQVATSTSVTVSESISVGLTVLDLVWSVGNGGAGFARPIPNSVSQTVMGPGSIWLPKQVPIAITLDGNVTACKISVSGIRTNYR